MSAFNERARIRLEKGGATKERSKMRTGVRSFTGSSYGSIRDFEAGKLPPSDNLKRRSDGISEMGKKVEPERRTIYRSIGNVNQKTIQGWLDGSGLERDGTFRNGEGNKAASASYTWSPEFARRWKRLDGRVTGRDNDPNKRWRVMFVAKNKSGVAVEPITINPGENEILVPREAEYKITGLSRARLKDGSLTDTIIIELEEK